MNNQALTPYLESLSKGDLGGCLKTLAPDVAISEPDSLPYGGDWVGHDGFLALFERISAHFEPVVLRHTVDHTESFSVVRMVVQFTAPTTEKTTEVNIVELYSFTDEGRISRIEVYYKEPKAITDLLDGTNAQ